MYKSIILRTKFILSYLLKNKTSSLSEFYSTYSLLSAVISRRYGSYEVSHAITTDRVLEKPRKFRLSKWNVRERVSTTCLPFLLSASNFSCLKVPLGKLHNNLSECSQRLINISEFFHMGRLQIFSFIDLFRPSKVSKIELWSLNETLWINFLAFNQELKYCVWPWALMVHLRWPSCPI